MEFELELKGGRGPAWRGKGGGLDVVGIILSLIFEWYVGGGEEVQRDRLSQGPSSLVCQDSYGRNGRNLDSVIWQRQRVCHPCSR
jgi:hypothetical protein